MKARKLSLRDEDFPDQSESMASRTRPRLEIEPIQIGIQMASPPPPSPPPPLSENEDLNIHTDLRLCFYFEPSAPAPEQPQQPQQPPLFPPPPPLNENQDFNIQKDLRMCVYFPQSTPEPEQPPPPQPDDNRHELPSTHVPQPQSVVVAPPATRRQRRNPTHAPRQGKPPTIQPPFPWATDRRAQVHSLKYLTEIGITTISGDVHCKRCDESYQIEYDLVQKFSEVSHYVAENKYRFRERAPTTWMNPTLPTCKSCYQENSAKPKMAKKKKSVNWLFLLLGEMLGCCTLDQLKYFCKHTGHHRTGAKDRVLFLTYLGLCKQVDPDGPFDRGESGNGYYS
ncbi:unnamed protein product [Lactuca saligna]|uniref:DUF7086 domain-containing protein n=1 Tax=Lactuca saligna TaxID=75948 RepID=A0AA35Z8Y9_LACSI|nr:unnamed protein product [Lactuca saligna]